MNGRKLNVRSEFDFEVDCWDFGIIEGKDKIRFVIMLNLAKFE